jgi:CRISPR/Cas system-associated endoribonuclease Cas2
MIRWCGESLTRESLQDLKNTTRPPPVVQDVLEAVSLLLGQPETRWDKLKKLLATPTFTERIQRLSFQQSINREAFRKLRDRLQHPDFDEEQIKSVCVAVVPLAMWCRAIGVYLSKTKFRGGPEIRPVAGAGAAIPLPPEPRQLERSATSGANMVFDPDIWSMSQEELRCVPNLSISRPDVGTILFHGTTDCTELDFERIVRLEIGEVLVYPDSSLKPPVGVGLNKAAIVTMYQCWPPNGIKLLQDQKSQERYKKKIQQMTEEKHARFMDYDCNSGIWKFSVEHF